MPGTLAYSFEDIISRLDDNTKFILRTIYSDHKEDAVQLAYRAVSVKHKIDNINLQKSVNLTKRN
jgi:hypothetical protein